MTKSPDPTAPCCKATLAGERLRLMMAARDTKLPVGDESIPEPYRLAYNEGIEDAIEAMRGKVPDEVILDLREVNEPKRHISEVLGLNRK